MSKVERFEDLAAWQQARELTRAIYTVSGDGRFAKDWGLSGQIQRAAVSVMSNIAEGFERYRWAEFHQFLSMAKGSCAEVRSQLYVARDLGYVDDASFRRLMSKAQDVGRLIGSLRASLEEKHKPPDASTQPSTQHSALSTKKRAP